MIRSYRTKYGVGRPPSEEGTLKAMVFNCTNAEDISKFVGRDTSIGFTAEQEALLIVPNAYTISQYPYSKVNSDTCILYCGDYIAKDPNNNILVFKGVQFLLTFKEVGDKVTE